MTDTISAIVVIAGIGLSAVIIFLGLFMLLPQRFVGEAETELEGTKVKVKGPVGLSVLVVGVALLGITIYQVASSYVASDSGQASKSGDAPISPPIDGADVDFIFPQEGSGIDVGQDVLVSGNVTGLGGDTLWILSWHEDGGSFYPVPPAIPKDGPWKVFDRHVGNSSDRDSNFVYYAVQANSDCARDLTAKSDSFRDLPKSCLVRNQRSIRVK
ncbi:MAG: hypothetical protein ACRDRA_06820 [Pseudonocardiaceae bacterium]